jgi:hypothetical protein
VEIPVLWVDGNQLQIKLEVSSAHKESTFGFKASVYPVFEESGLQRKTRFQNNFASNRGGGLAFGYSNLYPILMNVVFLNNTAQSGGGGLYFNANTIGGFVVNSHFTSNRVLNGLGGGTLVAALTSGMTFHRSSFHWNTAMLGAGLYAAYQNGVGGLDTGNEIVITNSMFGNNIASTSGGAFYFEFNNVVILNNLSVSNNSALSGSGGAMMMESQNFITIQESVFQYNFASQRGAAVCSLESNRLVIEWSDFLNNIANGLGGALNIQNFTSLTFVGKININDNKARLGGGAISSLRCPMWYLSNSLSPTILLILRNEANWGSALLFQAYQSEPGQQLQNITMKWNKAKVSGTVYWIYDAEMRSEVPGIHSRSVIIKENVATFGNRTATQPTRLISPDRYEVKSFGSPMQPGIELIWKDYYGHTVLSPIITTSVSVEILVDQANPFHCRKLKPILEGSDLSLNHVTFGSSGNATFNSLLPSCAPGGNFTLQFTAQLGSMFLSTTTVPLASASASQYYLTNTTFLSFRQCHRGEYSTSNGQCVTCEKGTFSFHFNEMKQCQDCSKMSGVLSCHADQLILSPGYWRKLPDSTAVFECPMVLESCIGGNETGIFLCAAGYTGPLCSVCSPGYFQSEMTCLACSGESLFTPILLIYFLLVIILLGIGLFFIFFRKKLLAKIEERQLEIENYVRQRGGEGAGGGNSPLALTSLHRIQSIRNSPVSNRQSFFEIRRKQEAVAAAEDDEAEEVQSDEGIEASLLPTRFEYLFIWLKTNWETIVVKSKIIVATYQVVVGIGDVVSVKFPSTFLAFTDTFSFFHLNLWNAIPLGCSMHISFIDKLILVTLAPIALISIFWMAFVIEFLYQTSATTPSHKKKSKEDVKKIYNELKDRYTNLLFYLSYVILPSVTSTIFETFLCENIDPYDEDGGADYYLQADRNISCSSTYYYHGVLYAVAMICVYPVSEENSITPPFP